MSCLGGPQPADRVLFALQREGFKIHQQDLRVGRFSAKSRFPASSEIPEDMATLDQCSPKAKVRAGRREQWPQLRSRATVLTTFISTPMVSAASDEWLVLPGPGGI